MKWDKAKTILIVYFIIVNICLGIYLVIDDINEKKSNELVSKTVSELLSKNNIEVSSQLIDNASKKKSAEAVYVRNIIDDYEKFSEKALMGEVKKGEKESYYNENGKISFEGDTFTIEALKNSHLLEKTVNEKNAVSVASEYLKAIGDENSKVIKSMEKTDDGFLVKFNMQIEKTKVLGAGVRIILDDGGVTKAYGCWYNVEGMDTSAQTLKSVSGVLIEYGNLKTDKSQQIEIEKIEIGYAVTEMKTYHESMMLTPVWTITQKDGKIKYIEARENT